MLRSHSVILHLCFSFALKSYWFRQSFSNSGMQGHSAILHACIASSSGLRIHKCAGFRAFSLLLLAPGFARTVLGTYSKPRKLAQDCLDKLETRNPVSPALEHGARRGSRACRQAVGRVCMRARTPPPSLSHTVLWMVVERWPLRFCSLGQKKPVAALRTQLFGEIRSQAHPETRFVNRQAQASPSQAQAQRRIGESEQQGEGARSSEGNLRQPAATCGNLLGHVTAKLKATFARDSHGARAGDLGRACAFGINKARAPGCIRPPRS